MKLSQLCATSRVRRSLNATSVHLVPTIPGRQPTKTRAVSSTGASSASARLQYGARGVSGPSASIKLSARLSPRALIRCPSRAASSSRVSYFSRVASSSSFNPRTRPSRQRARPLLNLVRRPQRSASTIQPRPSKCSSSPRKHCRWRSACRQLHRHRQRHAGSLETIALREKRSSAPLSVLASPSSPRGVRWLASASGEKRDGNRPRCRDLHSCRHVYVPTQSP